MSTFTPIPRPYPEGEPCGVIGHLTWCRCSPPDPNREDGYGPGHDEYERIAELNRIYCAQVEREASLEPSRPAR